MAEWIEWTDEIDCPHRARPAVGAGIQVESVIEATWTLLTEREGAVRLLAEMVHRGEALEQLGRRAKAQRGEIQELYAEVRSPSERSQLDGKAIGAGIVEALLPGVKLTGTDLVNLAEIHGTATGQAMKRDTTP